MFDIGFAELLIIAVVSLLVIGPERLPGAVRTGSAWLSRFRRSFNEIKQEVQQELHNDQVMRELRESGEKLRRETDALRQDLSDINPASDLLSGPGDTSARSGSTEETAKASPSAPAAGDAGDAGAAAQEGTPPSDRSLP